MLTFEPVGQSVYMTTPCDLRNTYFEAWPCSQRSRECGRPKSISESSRVARPPSDAQAVEDRARNKPQRDDVEYRGRAGRQAEYKPGIYMTRRKGLELREYKSRWGETGERRTRRIPYVRRSLKASDHSDTTCIASFSHAEARSFRHSDKFQPLSLIAST